MSRPDQDTTRRLLAALEQAADRIELLETGQHEPIAIIGMSCRLPGGADDPAAFWQLLHRGTDAISEVPPDRWDLAEYYDPDPAAAGKMYARHGGFITGVDQFDPQSFEIAPREATTLDPQHRLLLELTWQAFEDAGIPFERVSGTSAGVFVGITNSDYERVLARIGGDARIDAYFSSGNTLNAAAGRVAYVFGLQGPAMSVDTACSSSLVGVHLACQSLRRGECTLAVAAGVNLILSPEGHIALSRARMVAPDGRCKTFDAAADGYVRGEGGGVVILKRLSDALAAGDTPLAVIRGTAVNQDGASGGFTVPSGTAQQALLRRALADARLEPADVSYVEAHGTGTPLGDPIEVRALAAVYGAGRAMATPLLVGSLKTNIGHLESAAGVAGLIKLVLSLQHGQIPPHLHFREPSPHIPWDAIPLRVVTSATEWPDGPRRAGLSSFGASGTNAHVIVEEPPAPPAPEPSLRAGHAIVLSAKSDATLRAHASRLADWLETTDAELADVSFALSTRRSHFASRLALVAGSTNDAADALRCWLEGRNGRVLHGTAAALTSPRLLFVFTGESAAAAGALAELARTSPIVRRIVEEADEALSRQGAPPVLNGAALCSQFVLEVALAELYRSWGLMPAAIMGRGHGEYAAACVGRAFALQDGLTLITARTPVDAAAARIQPLRVPLLPFASGDAALTASGCDALVEIDPRTSSWRGALEQAAALHVRGIPVDWEAVDGRARRQPVTLPAYPFQRRRLWIEPAAAASLLGTRLDLPGADVRFETAIRPQGHEFLGDHRVQGEVVFPAAAYVSLALEAGAVLGGPAAILVEDVLFERPLILPRDAAVPIQIVLSPVGATWNFRIYAQQHGEWTLHAQGRLTTAPAQDRRSGVPADAVPPAAPEPATRGDLIAGEAYYEECARRGLDFGPAFRGLESLWRTGAGEAESVCRLPDGVPAREFPLHPVLLDAAFQTIGPAAADQDADGAYLPFSIRALRFFRRPAGVLSARARLDRAEPNDLHATVTLWDPEGVVALVEGFTLRRAATIAPADPLYVVDWKDSAPRDPSTGSGSPRAGSRGKGAPYVGERPPGNHASSVVIADSGGRAGALARLLALRGLTVVAIDTPDPSGDPDFLETAIRKATEGALGAIRAAVSAERPSRLWIVTRGAQPAGGTVTTASCAHAALWGLARTAAMEHPELRLVRIDLDPSATTDAHTDALIAEIEAGGPDDEVAFRGAQRLVPRLTRLTPPPRPAVIRSDRSYVITGGSGGLGLATAAWLIERGARRLVLLSRGAADAASPRIQGWRDAGATVLALSCDVSDKTALSRALDHARDLAPLAGLIHSAGTLADGAIVNLTWDQFARVLAAKVLGAWNLHQLTAQDDLDLFVLYASTAGVLGSPGQATHAAANACLDALAWHRLTTGRPAMSIDWGAWADVGMAARHQVGARARARGVGQIDPASGMRILERLVPHPLAQVAVAPVEWATFAAQFPAGGVPGIITDLAGLTPRGRTPRPAHGIRERIAAAEPDDRRSLLLAYTLERLSDVLDTPVPHIDAARPLNTLGLDSLMSLDVRNRIKNDLDADIPLTLLLGGASATMVADEVHGLLRQAPATASRPAAADATSVHPLTHGQQALWFLHRAAPLSPAYNTAIAVRIRSAVDAAALDRACHRLVARHDALRTRMATVDGVPAQHVRAAGSIPLELHDARGRDDDQLRRQVCAAYERPFDLERGPLGRFDLFTRDLSDHVLLITLHHIVGDAWSLWILIDELLQMYRSEIAGRLAPLPPVTPYAGFVRWQASRLSSAAGEADWDYWRTALAGELPTIDLPSDRPRPPVMQYEGASLDFAIPPALTDALRGVARSQGVTIYVLLLACLQVLLRRLSGQDDVVLGTLASGRSDPAFAETVGYFVNPIVVRTHVRGETPFAALVAEVREQVLRAMDHQDFPFALVVERLQPRRDPSRSPIFQVLFVLQKAPSSHAPAAIQGEQSADLRLEAFPFPQMEGQFDLTVEVTDADPLRGVLRYGTALFDRESMARLSAQLVELLRAVCDDPAAPVDRLAPLPEAEMQQLAAWNATGRAFPEDTCVHTMIDMQAARTPDAVAVVFDGRHWTYRELNERADALAADLRALGAGPETRVGLCMERSFELVQSILAVLKTGAAYVPLDPDYPRDRLEFMLQDSDVAILLRGTDPPKAMHAAPPRPFTAPAPDNIAYMIYTSGSTGRPKGAMNTHRGLCNRLTWMQAAYGLDGSDAVLQKTPFSFDVSVWEFLWPLMTGARLIVCKPGGHQDPRYLAEIIRDQGITTLHFVPSMLRAFVDQPDPGSFPSLRRVICSGEALPADLTQKALRVTGAEIHNLYGPTEASIDVTAWACREADEVIPIGAPIANTQIHIVDRFWNLCPIGVAGELCIGGVNVGRGYHARPDLTADRFVPDPFGPPGRRMYRTGDLARWRADGAVIYLGRMDTQVKIRGFRIELGEIDARLVEHPGIRDAAVIARPGTDGDARLIAYAVAEHEPPSTTELHRFLRETLPHYMVPAVFVWLPALPLSPNGKLDRRALPDPPADRPRLDREFEAPSTPMEETVAAAWRDVLGLDHIGIHDNFFELGGQSLLLAQVHATLQRDVAPALTLVDLFQHPTVHLMARHIGAPAAAAAVDEPARADVRVDRAARMAERRRSRLEHRKDEVPQP